MPREKEQPTRMDRSNGVASSSKRKDLVATPVKGGSSGIGLPYAPEDWPLPGDKWRWRVSKRTTLSGYFHDRFLIPPARFPRTKVPWSKGISSKNLAEQFVKKEIPGADLKDFWDSFLWKIPCVDAKLDKVQTPSSSEKKTPPAASSRLFNGHIVSIIPPDCGNCKVGNKMCHLRVKARKDILPILACDICCSESGFCRDCSCILCGAIIDSVYGGYGHIRCQASVDIEGEKFICGHVAHMDCAFRAFLAGTVGGYVALDAEYYCRRCDNKSDLVPYLTELLKSCKAIDSRDDVGKILSLSSGLLRGSLKPKANDLHSHIEKIMAKLRDGFKLEEIWKVENNSQTVQPGAACPRNEVLLLGRENGSCSHRSLATSNGIVDSRDDTYSDSNEQRFISSDFKTASLDLENDIDNALLELKKSQDQEYRLAEEKLYAQKDLVLGLYQELEAGRKGLTNPAVLPNEAEAESFMSDYLSRVNQIQAEETKLKVMMQISKGFGQTSKDILRGLYGVQVDG